MGKSILSLIGHGIIDTLYVAFCTTIYLYSRILVLRSTGSFRFAAQCLFYIAHMYK